MHRMVTMPLNLDILKLYTRLRLYIFANIIPDFSAQNYAHHSILKFKLIQGSDSGNSDENF